MGMSEEEKKRKIAELKARKAREEALLSNVDEEPAPDDAIVSKEALHKIEEAKRVALDKATQAKKLAEQGTAQAREKVTLAKEKLSKIVTKRKNTYAVPKTLVSKKVVLGVLAVAFVLICSVLGRSYFVSPKEQTSREQHPTEEPSVTEQAPIQAETPQLIEEPMAPMPEALIVSDEIVRQEDEGDGASSTVPEPVIREIDTPQVSTTSPKPQVSANAAKKSHGVREKKKPVVKKKEEKSWQDKANDDIDDFANQF